MAEDITLHPGIYTPHTKPYCNNNGTRKNKSIPTPVQHHTGPKVPLRSRRTNNGSPNLRMQSDSKGERKAEERHTKKQLASQQKGPNN